LHEALVLLLFFIVLYLHIAKGLFLNSYRLWKV